MTHQPSSWAFFDFDDTLVRGDSILLWRKYYYQKKPLKRIFQIVDTLAVLLHILRIIDSQTLKRFFFIPVSYETSTEINRLAEDFVREKLVPLLYSDIVDLVFAHHKLGHGIVIISASSQFYLKFLSQNQLFHYKNETIFNIFIILTKKLWSYSFQAFIPKKRNATYFK